MSWNGDGCWTSGGAGYVLMVLGMVAFWALVIAAVAWVWALRQPVRPGRAPGAAVVPDRTPQQLLAERFAAGEVDETELVSRLATLREHQLL